MQFVVTKQIAVEADTPEDAVVKSGDGKTISLNVNARPQPAVPRNLQPGMHPITPAHLQPKGQQ